MASSSSHTQESLLQVDETLPTRSFSRLLVGLSTTFAVCALSGLAIASRESRMQHLRGVKVDGLTALSEHIKASYGKFENNFDENSAPYRDGLVTGLGPSGVWNHESLEDLEGKHKYGKQTDSQKGLGGSVSLRAPQDMIFLKWAVQPGDLVKFGDTLLLGKVNDRVVKLKAGSSGSIMRTEDFSERDVIKRGQKVLIIGHPIPQPMPVTFGFCLFLFTGFAVSMFAGIYLSKSGTPFEKGVEAQRGYHPVAHDEQVTPLAVHTSSPKQATPAFTATRHVQQQKPRQAVRPGPVVAMPAAVILFKRFQAAAALAAAASAEAEKVPEKQRGLAGGRPGLPRVSREARTSEADPEAPVE